MPPLLTATAAANACARYDSRCRRLQRARRLRSKPSIARPRPLERIPGAVRLLVRIHRLLPAGLRLCRLCCRLRVAAGVELLLRDLLLLGVLNRDVPAGARVLECCSAATVLLDFVGV